MQKKEYFQRELLKWYDKNHRILPWRETIEPYYIWISEIILQQTRVAQGYDYYLRFINRFPDVQTLAQADEDEVLLYWQGLGYYSRARNLHAAAQQIMERHGGIFPSDYKDVRALKGVGDYTAAAICSFAYNQPYAVLDGNVYRVLARLFDDETVMDTTQGKKHFHQLATDILNVNEPAMHNQSMMEFGALYCVPQNADCEHCPLQVYCQAYAHHTVELLPVRKPTAPLKDRYLNYFIFLLPDNTTLIHRREKQDIWKHLYEFPLIESDHLFTLEEASKLMANGERLIAQGTFKHILSHQRLHAQFFVVCAQDGCELSILHTENCIRISFGDLSNFALSRLTLKAVERLKM